MGFVERKVLHCLAFLFPVWLLRFGSLTSDGTIRNPGSDSEAWRDSGCPTRQNTERSKAALY